MLFGFYFLLAFVGVTIPAGIYGKKAQLGFVDWESAFFKATRL